MRRIKSFNLRYNMSHEFFFMVPEWPFIHLCSRAGVGVGILLRCISINKIVLRKCISYAYYVDVLLRMGRLYQRIEFLIWQYVHQITALESANFVILLIFLNFVLFKKIDYSIHTFQYFQYF